MSIAQSLAVESSCAAVHYTCTWLCSYYAMSHRMCFDAGKPRAWNSPAGPLVC